MDPLYRSYLFYEPETVDDPNRQTQIAPEFAPVGNLCSQLNPYLAAKYAADRNLLCHSSVNLATLVAHATPFR